MSEKPKQFRFFAIWLAMIFVGIAVAQWVTRFLLHRWPALEALVFLGLAVVGQFTVLQTLEMLGQIANTMYIGRMAKRLPKRPRDTNELAVSIVRIAIGEEENDKPSEASERAIKGGEARAEKLSPRKRRQIAKKAAAARWKKK